MSSEEKKSLSPMSSSSGGGRRREAPVSNRRMNSLARLIHTNSPKRRPIDSIETAVTIGRANEDELRGRVFVAHNVFHKDKLGNDAQRLGVIRQVVRGELKARHAVKTLGEDSPLNQRRLLRDLRKLRKSYNYEGTNDERLAARGMMRDAFGGEKTMVADFTDRRSFSYGGKRKKPAFVHAETALIHSGHGSKVGTSRRSCQDCFDFSLEKRPGALSDTHGKAYNGWVDPETQRVTQSRGYQGRTNYHRVDSESDIDIVSEED